MGKYLIGYNDSTMNDYIINNKIGLLLKKKEFQRIFQKLYKNQKIIEFNTQKKDLNNLIKTSSFYTTL